MKLVNSLEDIRDEILTLNDTEELKRRYIRYDELVYNESIGESARRDLKLLKLHVQSRIFELTKCKDGELMAN